ncbi:hypothetical protein CWS02_19380 [Enterobacter sp. EA-1]|nr:hypothetical protein CWS02_19380 [Enterobacter sp. EA-1]
MTQERGAETSAGGSVALISTGHTTLKGRTVAGQSLAVTSATLDNSGTPGGWCGCDAENRFADQ